MNQNNEYFVPEVAKENYDERLLNTRFTAEGNVVGCLLKNLELYDDCSLEEKDFITKQGRYCFLIVKKMRQKGLNIVDEITFMSTLEKSFIEQVNGVIGDFKNLTHIINAVNIANWDGYLDNLNKQNVILRLYKKGFTVFNKITLDNGKEIVPYNFFEELTCQEVLEFYEGTITSLQTNLHSAEVVEEGYMEFDDIWLDKVKQKEELGVSFGEAGVDVDGETIRTFPFMSNNTLGLKPGTVSAWASFSGNGKAIPNYTMIPTPNGYRRVGDIKPGDYLFGQNGKPVKVLQIHPQPEQKEIWKVTFKDGRVAECCKDHLWEYEYKSYGKYYYKTETIEQLYNRCKGHFTDRFNHLRYRIKINQPVEYPQKQFNVHPYILGALLGNGYLKDDHLQFSSSNTDILDIICSLDNTIHYQKGSLKNYTYYFKDLDGHIVKTSDYLKDYPELVNTHSHDKFIPKDYLCGSVDQRLSLLQGLLDTDGTISKTKGRIMFSTTSHQLKDDVVELCRSLGLIPIAHKEKRTRYVSGACYTINIQAPKSMKPKLFKTSSKLNRAIEYANTDKREERRDYLGIVNVEKTNIKTDMTCFTVDSEDHLFLMNDYIVTHNTQTLVTTAMSLMSKGEKVLFITNESSMGDLKALFLTWIIFRVFKYTKLTKRKFLSGEYDEEDAKMIKKAQQYWKENYAKSLKVQSLPDANTSLSVNLIKKAVLREGFSTFIVDTMKMDIGGNDDNFWISFIKDVRALTVVAMKYNLIGLLTFQLAPSFMSRCWLDSNCLANSKQVKETLSNLILFRKLKPGELDPESPYYIHPYRNKQDENGNWYEEPYPADPNLLYIVMFVDKTRRGVDSGMDGTAYLCRTDFDHVSFYETARCRPTHKITDSTGK